MRYLKDYTIMSYQYGQLRHVSSQWSAAAAPQRRVVSSGSRLCRVASVKGGHQTPVSTAPPRVAAQQIVALPFAQWPRWARALANRRAAGEMGVGDTVRRLAARFGGTQLKRWSRKIKLPCRCRERQAEWNRRYPYDAKMVAGQN
jgi:hypothetical protein